MSCTDQQSKEIYEHRLTDTQERAVAKTGIDLKTARKYEKSGKLPSEVKEPRQWRTHKDAFAGDIHCILIFHIILSPLN